MFEKLKNMKNIKKESLSYENFRNLIDSIDKNTKINFNLEYINQGIEYDRFRDFNEINPKFISRFSEKNLKPLSHEDYFNAEYKILSLKESQKHYITLESGKKKTDKKNILKKTRAELEWIVEKER